MKLLALAALLLVPLATAAPAPQDSAPSPSPSPKPPVSYIGRRLLFRMSFGECMKAEGAWDGAKVGISTDCINQTPLMSWDTGAPHTLGEIRLTNTNLCLDAGDWNSRGNGRKVRLRTCGQGANGAQSWWYPTNEKSRVELGGPPPRAHSIPPHSGYCLDLTDGNKRGQLQIWTCYDGNQNQVWALPPWCVHC
ncbi:hypothetical protein Q8F55_006137 [Vanrija albida]|uniref:Ricin B lectin domain-containing protein n=1 Tax=Vanrija albida TaxID=181172 RepID=A0ABR3PW87_9TREE